MADEDTISGIEDSSINDGAIRGIRKIIADETTEAFKKMKVNTREGNSHNPILGEQYIQSLLDDSEEGKVPIEMLTSIFGTGTRGIGTLGNSTLFLNMQESINEFNKSILNDFAKNKLTKNITLPISTVAFYINLLDYKTNKIRSEDNLKVLHDALQRHLQENGHESNLYCAMQTIYQSYDIVLLYWKENFGEKDIQGKITYYKQQIDKIPPLTLWAPIKVLVNYLAISNTYKKCLEDTTIPSSDEIIKLYEDLGEDVVDNISHRKGARHGAQYPYLSSVRKLLNMSDESTANVLLNKVFETVGVLMDLDISSITQRVLGKRYSLGDSIGREKVIKIYNELVYIRLSKVNDPLYAFLYLRQSLDSVNNTNETVEHVKQIIQLLRLCKPDTMIDSQFAESGVFELCSKTLDNKKAPEEYSEKPNDIELSSSFIPFLKPEKDVRNVSQILLPDRPETVMWESVQFRIDEVQSKVDSHSGTLESQKEMIGLAIQEVEKLIKEQTREELRVGKCFLDKEQNSVRGGFKDVEVSSFISLSESILQVVNEKGNGGTALSSQILFGSGIGSYERLKYTVHSHGSADPRYHYDIDSGSVLIIDRGKYSTFSIDQENIALVVSISKKLIKLYEELEQVTTKILHKDILLNTTIDFSKLSIPGIGESELSLLWSKFIEGDTNALGSGINILRLISQKEVVIRPIPLDSLQLTLSSELVGVPLEDMKQISLFSYLDKYLQSGQNIPESFFKLIVEIYQEDYRTFLREYKEYQALTYQLGSKNPEESVYSEGGYIALNTIQKTLSERKMYCSLLNIGVAPENINTLLSTRSQRGLIDPLTKNLEALLFSNNDNVIYPESSQSINTNTLRQCMKQINNSVYIQKDIEKIVEYQVRRYIYNMTSKESTNLDGKKIPLLYENISKSVGNSQFKHYIRHIQTLGDQKEYQLFEDLESLLLDINPKYKKGCITFSMSNPVKKVMKELDSQISGLPKKEGLEYIQLKDYYEKYYNPTKQDNTIFVPDRETDCEEVLNGLKDIHFTIKNAPSPRALKTATYYSTSLGNRKVTSDTTIANPDKSIIARYATSLDERGRRLGFDRMQMLPEYDLLSDKYWFENYPISKETELYVSHGSPIKTWLFLYGLGENENIEFNKIYSLRVNGGKFCLESSLPLNDHPATINFLETLLGIQFFGPEEEKDLILMEEKLASVFDLMEYNKRVETRDLITNKAIRVFGEGSTTHTYLIRLLENIVNTDPDDDTQ